MNPATQLFRNIYELVLDVKDNLRRQGFVVPTRLKDGSIKLGRYIIVKNSGLYNIIDHRHRTVIEGINLPHTAILVANTLELGRSLDYKLLQADQNYGYANFEEKNFQKISDAATRQKDWDRFDTIKVKHTAAQQRAFEAKRLVLGSYEKLRRSR